MEVRLRERFLVAVTHPSTDTPPLLVAAKYKQKDEVETLIAPGWILDCRDKSGWTVLHYAAVHGWLSTVESLVENGAELDAKLSPPASDPATPLLLAAQRDHTSVMSCLIEAGADITCRGRNGTVMSYALKGGNMDVIRLLAKREVDFNSRSLCDDFPLLEAAKSYQKEVVQFLIDSGVDRNCRCCEGGWTLMHFAARNRWPDVLRQTDSETVEQCAANDRVTTPLHVACEFDMRCLDSIRGFGVPLEWEEFDEMAARAFVEVTELLFEKGFDVNARNSWGATPAHLAYHSLVTRAAVEVETTMKLRVFSCLFGAGADCNIEDDYGKSLFNLFISTEEIELIRLAIENGGYFKKEFQISTHIQQSILRDVCLCTMVLVNKYNKMDLPAVYELCNLVDGKFPSLEKMKINIEGGVAKAIETAVRRDIEEQGYCNIFRISPLSLSLLVVNSILN
ncbi:hypothetical protein JTE90_028346 [Oedothorax gibbosus]|uniref:Ankyrin repeat protein n=1 Tax=Oedothorax gibbosus TaxID=931172 RepID=A0AAV6V3L6_9ARAC|nr:hypothetical protein JTE90_028346 [Oedothorax gibbosus]